MLTPVVPLPEKSQKECSLRFAPHLPEKSQKECSIRVAPHLLF